MARFSTKSIATVLQIVLGIFLLAILGLLLNMLAGHPILSRWVITNPRNSLWILSSVAISVIVLAILLEIWKRSTPTEYQPATREDLDAATRKILEGFYESAVKEGLIPEQALKDKDAEITRLTAELQKLQQQLAARSSEPHGAEPYDAELSKLLAAGDLDAAVNLASKQVETFREASGKLPRALYELGTIHELRFEWLQALAAYREAWELGHDPKHGFQCAVIAQKLNHFNEAIPVYEALLRIYTDPPDRARTLNNLANLYRATQRMKEAEKAHGEALAIRHNLAQANPGAYLPYIATTLNNLAGLYRDTQRIQKSEEAINEALVIYRKLAEANPGAYLPDVATTLNNLGLLYNDTQRMNLAENAYVEALAIRRKLAEANPDAYLPDVAATLNNLAVLYGDTQRMNPAEQAYGEALATYRNLAEVNPDAWLPDVAMTLNNLAILYRNTQRIKEAEQVYDEALAIRRKLADDNPDAFLPDVAMTLNNLAVLYRNTQRMKEAEQTYNEALDTYRNLAQANPDAYLPDVAMTLNNLANLSISTGQIQEAETQAAEAERILEPLWQANPELHGNQMARILFVRALIREVSQKPAAEACTLARRALAAAYDPSLKQSIQQLIDRLCPAS